MIPRPLSVAEVRALQTKPAKYRNVKSVASDGSVHDSRKEARRWEELKLLERAGLIRDLLPHPSVPIYVNGSRTGRLSGDAIYVEHGRLVIEDTKSGPSRTQAYRARLKVFRAAYPGIEWREVE